MTFIKACYLYLVHDLCIGLSKGIWHVMCLGGEFEHAGMLTVFPLAQDRCCFLGFLHINRTNWHPSCSLDPCHISLVHSLHVPRVRKGRVTWSLLFEK